MGMIDGILAHALATVNSASTHPNERVSGNADHSGYHFYTPKYTGSNQDQWMQYAQAVQKVNPDYQLSQGIYSPHMGNMMGQVNDLKGLLEQTKFGSKYKFKPVTPQQEGFNPDQLYGSHGGDLPKAIQEQMLKADQKGQKKENQGIGKIINDYISYAQKNGASADDAIFSLYQQLSGKKGSKTKNVNDSYAHTQAGQIQAVQKTPQWQLNNYTATQLMPQIGSQAQDLFNTANALDVYQHASSKQRTAMGGKPSTTGIKKLLNIPDGVPINGDTIRQFTQSNLLSPQGVQNWISNYIITQSKKRGVQENDLQALMDTSNNAGKGLGPNATPLGQMIYDYMKGGAIGKKKTTGVGASTGVLPSWDALG